MIQLSIAAPWLKETGHRENNVRMDPTLRGESKSFHMCSTQCGKLVLSVSKKYYYWKISHISSWCLWEVFRRGFLNEDEIENADLTHFVIDSNNGCMLYLEGDKNLRYADFVSCSHSVEMMIKPKRREKASTKPLNFILQNENSFYQKWWISEMY